MANGVIDKALQNLLGLAIEVKTLWTNASPTSGFAAQSVSLTGGVNYDAILISFLASSSESTSSGTIEPLLLAKSHKGYVVHTAKTDSTNSVVELRARAVTFSGAEATFAAAYGFSVTSTTRSVRADYVVPYKIIGIKFLRGGA